MEKKTPLYDCHVALKGKIVPFAGYLLPVQYEAGLITEHMAVRTKAGLFDVSHMAELVLKGPDALKNVNMLVTVECGEMTDGQVKYSPMCNENGGIVDDLMVYRINSECYLLVVNAANHEKDADWIRAHISGDVIFEDISDGVAQLALQGPKAKDILCKLCCGDLLPSKYYTFVERCVVKSLGGKEAVCLISQTGYTGEHGYELYCAAEEAADLWMALLEAGKEEGLIPCGLGARDTLRLEAAMPLYGHEMNDEISPREAGLGFFVKMAKEDFIGKAAIEARGTPQIKRVGLEITGRGIAREHSAVLDGDTVIGEVTSGTHCPYVGKAVAMAYVPAEYAALDTVLAVDVRGRKIEAKVIKLPFYKRA